MNQLELIIKKWLNNGGKCNSSIKPYTRSLYPTYNPGIRNRKHHLYSSKTKKKSKLNQSNQNVMIQMCEDFLKKNKKLIRNLD